MKRILVIDGNSIINRAFYGVRPLTTKTGKNTNAIYGMINIVAKHLNKLAPDYAAVCFDVKAPTFRHRMYAHYKEGRHPTPPELSEQFPDAKECLSLMGFPVLELPGYEADDLQGTVAKMVHGMGDDAESYVLSGDRDLLQLIDEKVTVILEQNGGAVYMHAGEFREKYGIAPGQFVDMKALMGDTSDNIPGVTGIGEKTAGALIAAFGSLDGVYEHIYDPAIKKGVREKLVRDRENAYLSRTLAAIDTQVPLPCGLEDLRYRGIDREGLYRKFSELELLSLLSRFSLTAPPKPADTAVGDGHHAADKSAAGENGGAATEGGTGDPHIPAEGSASSPADDGVTRHFEECSAGQILENLGNRFAAEYKEGKLYLSNGSFNPVYGSDFSAIAPLFSAGHEILCFDGKALWHILDRAGVAVSDEARFLDLMLYGYVLNPGSGNADLASLCAMFLGVTPPQDTPCPSLYFPLEEKMRQKIREDGEEKILDELEIPLLNILAGIEKVGFRVDTEGLRQFGDALGDLAEDLKNKIYMQTGEAFNLNSPKQLGEMLFVKMGLPYHGKKTKTGYSTDAETLEELSAFSPVVEDILEYRQVTKLRSTYALVLPQVADEHQRVHTDFKQALTATGRLSSADPNLQNIPIRTRMGREMRRYFIAADGYTLVDADYSQIELRLLAHISGDYHMIETFRAGEDIHRMTAAAVFGVPEEAVSEEMRKRAKAVNFGIVYGISGFSLSKNIGTTRKEADQYIRSYMMNYPAVEEYLEKVVEEARVNGYTRTPMGRRRYIPELSAQNRNIAAFGKRVAMNAPIQGAAADIMKLAMIRVGHRLRAEGLDARIVMQVHDELVVEARTEIAERVASLLREEMEGVVSLSIPLTVDVTEGKNWLEQQ